MIIVMARGIVHFQSGSGSCWPKGYNYSHLFSFLLGARKREGTPKKDGRWNWEGENAYMQKESWRERRERVQSSRAGWMHFGHMLRNAILFFFADFCLTYTILLINYMVFRHFLYLKTTQNTQCYRMKWEKPWGHLSMFLNYYLFGTHLFDFYWHWLNTSSAVCAKWMDGTDDSTERRLALTQLWSIPVLVLVPASNLIWICTILLFCLYLLRSELRAVHFYHTISVGFRYCFFFILFILFHCIGRLWMCRTCVCCYTRS